MDIHFQIEKQSKRWVLWVWNPENHYMCNRWIYKEWSKKPSPEQVNESVLMFKRAVEIYRSIRVPVDFNYVVEE